MCQSELFCNILKNFAKNGLFDLQFQLVSQLNTLAELSTGQIY